jgi:hypothetical protein
LGLLEYNFLVFPVFYHFFDFFAFFVESFFVGASNASASATFLVAPLCLPFFWHSGAGRKKGRGAKQTKSSHPKMNTGSQKYDVKKKCSASHPNTKKEAKTKKTPKSLI